MGGVGSKFKYFFSPKEAIAVGAGTDLSKDKHVTQATVHVVPEEGPFDKASSVIKDVRVGDFWKEKRVIVHLLRRFGCRLCRAAALEISSIKPILDKHDVRLVGVGLGYDSLDSFIEGKYWRGNELFVDEEKNLYQALKLANGKLMDLFNKEVKAHREEAHKKFIDGNMSGDGMQMGGTYVIDQSGIILFEFQQRKWGDHPKLEDLLTALNIPLSELDNRLPDPQN